MINDEISQALKGEDWNVREHAIQHPNATIEHISQALKDEDSWVRWQAQERFNKLNALQKLKFKYKDNT